MDKDNTGKIIESYLLGDLQSKEKENFEQKLKTDFDLKEELYFYRIVFYLNDELPKEERERFEQDLETDVNLQEDLRLQKISNNFIEKHFLEKNELAQWDSFKDLAEDIPAIRREEKDVPIVQIEPQKKKRTSIALWKKIAIVAACFVVVSIVSLKTLLSPSGFEIAQESFELVQFDSAERSGDITVENTEEDELLFKLNNAQSKLNNHNFKAAIPFLEQSYNLAVKEENPIQYKIQYALATAHIEENYEKAITTYEKLLKEDDLGAKLDSELVKKARYNLYILKIKNMLDLEN